MFNATEKANHTLKEHSAKLATHSLQGFRERPEICDVRLKVFIGHTGAPDIYQVCLRPVR